MQFCSYSPLYIHSLEFQVGNKCMLYAKKTSVACCGLVRHGESNRALEACRVYVRFQFPSSFLGTKLLTQGHPVKVRNRHAECGADRVQVPESDHTTCCINFSSYLLINSLCWYHQFFTLHCVCTFLYGFAAPFIKELEFAPLFLSIDLAI